MIMEMKDLPTERSGRVRDQRIGRIVELISPAQILEELPLCAAQEDVVLGHRAEVARILDREDDRLLVVVGPCSVHDVEAALEYARRLSARAAELQDDLCIAMRVYFEKPRTTIGWKGLINDPHLDGSGDVNVGLQMARGLLLRGARPGAADRLRVPGSDHARSTSPTWSPGARSAPARPRARSIASSPPGLSMPVGFKNATDGDVKVAVDAVRAAAAKHAFAGIETSGRPAIFHTEGNDDCHVILRGGRGRPQLRRRGRRRGAAELRRRPACRSG